MYTQPAQPAQPVQPAKKSKLPWILAGIGVVGFLCICLFVVVALNSSGERASTTEASTTEASNEQVEQPVPVDTPVPAPTDVPLPTDTPLPPPTQNIGQVGERREMGGVALTVLGVSKLTSIDIWTPEAGNVFLVIEVLIENANRDEETPYNPFYFSVKDSDGFEYSLSFASPEPSLQSGSLVKGDKARGFVAFEVKETASGLVVTYEPLVILGGYEPIRINLGQ